MIDGDTLEMTVDTGFRSRHVVHVRLSGVNAPETSSPEGKAAKAALATLVATHPGEWPVTVVTQRIKSGEVVSFERYVATVVLDGIDLAEWLVANGYAERTG